MDERRKDTRSRIQDVALDLFTEQGYEKTSLREIADRLGVTKAALYYHFKAKEDIITSVFEDLRTEVDEIIVWAAGQRRTAETRREVVRRYGVIAQGRTLKMMRFMSENHHAVADLKAGNVSRERMLTLAGMMLDEDASLIDRLRMRMAFFTVSMSIFLSRDLDVTDDEAAAAALEIGLGLAGDIPDRRPETAATSTPAERP